MIDIVGFTVGVLMLHMFEDSHLNKCMMFCLPGK